MRLGSSACRVPASTTWSSASCSTPEASSETLPAPKVSWRSSSARVESVKKRAAAEICDWSTESPSTRCSCARSTASGGERDRPVAHEDDTDRAVRYGRREVEFALLEEGKLYLTTPVAHRTISDVFVGHGSISFTPPLAVERAQLQRVLGDSVLQAERTSV